MCHLVKYSPEVYLNLAIPANASDDSDGGLPASLTVDDLKKRYSSGIGDVDIFTSKWSDGFIGLEYQLEYALRSRRHHKVQVTSALRSSDSFEDKYIYPVIDIAKRHLFSLGVPALQTRNLSASDDPFHSIEISFDGSRPVYTSDVSSVVDMNYGAYKDKIYDYLSRKDKERLGEENCEESTPPWVSFKRSFCVAMFVKPGIAHLEELEAPHYRPLTSVNDEMTRTVVQILVWHCEQTGADFGLLTDEHRCATFDLRSHDRSNIQVDVYPVSTLSVRKALSYFVRFGGKELGLCAYFPCNAPYLGALNDPLPVESIDELMGTRNCFRHFDPYTMQRDPSLFDNFLQWKANMQVLAEGSPISEDQVITVECNGFSRRRLQMWKSPFTSAPLPQDTLEIVTRSMRPRNLAIDKALESSPTLNFVVKKVLQSGECHSQVLLGHLSGIEEAICLKLFDERLFPWPDGADFLDIPPEERLVGWLNFSDEMMHREEGAYDRLKHLQGSVVPHCYGFHLFTLPSGWRAFGLFMEVIKGPCLHEIEDVGRWSQEKKADFVKNIRHAVRAIKYAGIDQQDWHLGQVICPPSSREGAPGVVLIDFAFAEQPFGELNNPIPRIGLIDLHAYLLFDTDLGEELVEQFWFPLEDDEM